jgi:hypothetical protein
VSNHKVKLYLPSTEAKRRKTGVDVEEIIVAVSGALVLTKSLVRSDLLVSNPLMRPEYLSKFPETEKATHLR